ncbi:Rid family detoxifying hydrolase [Geothrix fermentans]|uniref:Rid family detoxifying hydrolase n=1 Tax=Geothrix fermentans TaxID=44676 RepID=UPI0003FBE9B9|nr:Rid family detoxifying hydrolase [Geothrix fermentans]
MRAIATPTAPAAIGPYSQAQISGGHLFTSGQIPLVPETMEMVTGPIEAQAAQVLKNLSAVLAASNTSWDRVVKTTVFLTDMGDFAAFNAVYEQALGGAKPARSTVAVAALPRGAKVEIELIAEV